MPAHLGALVHRVGLEKVSTRTAHLLDELALHGHLPGQDEPDPRPLPEPEVVRGQLGAMFEAFIAMAPSGREKRLSRQAVGLG